MRWIASLVAEGYRILIRGGVFLYPADQRRGYRHGRLRLVYEANPIAFLIEQAGGAASDGAERILDIVPEPAPAHAGRLRLGATRSTASPATTPSRAPSASARRCSAIAACSAPEESDMSVKHPIISVTGSSGAGTTSVQATPSSRSSAARRSTPPSSRATPSTATTARR